MPGELLVNGYAKAVTMFVKHASNTLIPGEEALLRQTFEEARMLVTIDSDFGALICLEGQAHSGVIRLPYVPARARLSLMARILDRYSE